MDPDKDKESGQHLVLELLKKKEGLLEFASGVDRSFRWNPACRLQIPTFLLNREEKKAGAVCSALVQTMWTVVGTATLENEQDRAGMAAKMVVRR